MTYKLALLLIACVAPATLCSAQQQPPDDLYISPSRPVPAGKAPTMRVKEVKDTPEEKVYAIVFYKGDEVLSGLTDFAIQHKIEDAHLLRSAR
jgi:hypothetical protein